MSHTVVSRGVPTGHPCQPVDLTVPPATVVRCDDCGQHWLWFRDKWTPIGEHQAQLIGADNRRQLTPAAVPS